MDNYISVKVCGLNDQDNIKLISGCGPDFIGFIFYRHSKRYVGNSGYMTLVSCVQQAIKKVGVFVNEEPEFILKTAGDAGLGIVQLHGNESPSYCGLLKSEGLAVIKSFEVGETFIPEYTDRYSDACDYFLFDTLNKECGGSGKKFNWELIHSYPFGKPFFISGGIGPEDHMIRQSVRNEKFFGVDINSRFEISPGIKDVEKVKNFISKIKK